MSSSLLLSPPLLPLPLSLLTQLHQHPLLQSYRSIWASPSSRNLLHIGASARSPRGPPPRPSQPRRPASSPSRHGTPSARLRHAFDPVQLSATSNPLPAHRPRSIAPRPCRSSRQLGGPSTLAPGGQPPFSLIRFSLEQGVARLPLRARRSARFHLRAPRPARTRCASRQAVGRRLVERSAARGPALACPTWVRCTVDPGQASGRSIFFEGSAPPILLPSHTALRSPPPCARASFSSPSPLPPSSPSHAAPRLEPLAVARPVVALLGLSTNLGF